ncbi:unnamed protein product [Adineta steineri]|uniref:Uncharacterized protein n=1 Tax=Adineta steineri TaxID=433720 RepID=A0A818RVB7_9BILA|nr:unnamed protein product [Adineta steineri]CAF3662904.1 unnamed protein product [Adineta steineri]
MADVNDIQISDELKYDLNHKNEHRSIFLNTDELRFQNREQLIEKLERVIQEKNASINKLEEREQSLADTLKKRNAEFHIIEEKLQEFREKTCTFEQLHQLQVQTFEKTIRDCQNENERLSEQIRDLKKELSDKTNFDAISQEKILTFDRITADIQLWRQKLDSYKATIEEREETIATLKNEINDFNKKKQTNGNFEDNSLRLQILNLQNVVRDRDKEIENLKTTLRRVRDTLQPDHLSHESRWQSCSENIGHNRSSSVSDLSSSREVELLKKKLNSLTDRYNDLQKLLIKRDDQIVTFKKVHDKRWLRLKHLQKQYRSLKDELQSYTDDEIIQNNTKEDFSYRKAIQKTKNSCSVCNDQRWKKPPNGLNKKTLKQEDDDHVWNEITKFKRENARLSNENLSLNEKIDLQEVEINEQLIVIDELRHELRRFNDKDDQPRSAPIAITNNEQKQLIEELDKKLYELETERTCLIFEHERLKTDFDLCVDEKQRLIQQKTQINNDLKQCKLRILALQDQIYKLKRNNKKEVIITTPILTRNRRIIKKKPKKPIINKTCLELLLDQTSSFIDDYQNESFISNKQRRRRRHRSCSLCNYENDNSFIKHKKRLSIPIRRCGPLKRTLITKNRLNNSNSTRKSSTTPFINQSSSLRKRIEQLENNLSNAQEENRHLNQRLITTLSRINILKTTNQKLIGECDKFKNNHLNQSTSVNHDSISTDSMDNLYERLKNTSYDASQQRKLNKTLQSENELLNKNIHSLTDKLTHTERDIASKRLLIDSYKSRLNEMEINVNRSNEKNTNDNDEERIKSLTDTIEKLRTSIDSYKNRLQAITREKHDFDTRNTQLGDEHQKLKIRFDDIQSKFRLNDQQLRQIRLQNEQLNQELATCRRLSEQQLLTLNTKSQESLKKLTSELDRTIQRSNEYEKFIKELLNELIQRNIQMNDSLKKAREYQKQRESLSLTLPGYDTAMNTASKILNLTQDDLDELMSVTDESFQANIKEDNVDKNEKIRQKVSKLFVSQEEVSNKLLKIFNKKFDEIQAVNRELAIIRIT